MDLARVQLPAKPIVDLFPHLSLEHTLHLLARVGLAEAPHSFLLPPAKLSAGQRWRLRLALALSREFRLLQHSTNLSPIPIARTTAVHHAPTSLMADEFAALLDRVTAAILARILRRIVSASSTLSAILATSHDDLIAPLCPDVIIACDFGAWTVLPDRAYREPLGRRNQKDTPK
jgi:ABC-type lipoprotein export system ATPase subunit